MKNIRFPIFIIFTCFLFSFAYSQMDVLKGKSLTSSDLQSDTTSRLVLCYSNPATEWIEALPIGNGRLGVMDFGNTSVERLQLN